MRLSKHVEDWWIRSGQIDLRPGAINRVDLPPGERVAVMASGCWMFVPDPLWFWREELPRYVPYDD